MKRLIYLLAFSFMMFSCEDYVGYNIKVSKSDGKEDTVSLYVYEPLSKMVRKINEGKLSLNSVLKLEGANDTISKLAYLRLKNDTCVYYFVLDNESVEFDVSGSEFKITNGSKLNKEIYNKVSGIKSLCRIKDSLLNSYNEMIKDTTLTALKESEILENYKVMKDSLQTVLMKTMNDSGVQPYIIWRQFGNLMHRDSVVKIKNKADYIL